MNCYLCLLNLGGKSTSLYRKFPTPKIPSMGPSMVLDPSVISVGSEDQLVTELRNGSISGSTNWRYGPVPKRLIRAGPLHICRKSSRPIHMKIRWCWVTWSGILSVPHSTAAPHHPTYPPSFSISWWSCFQSRVIWAFRFIKRFKFWSISPLQVVQFWSILLLQYWSISLHQAVQILKHFAPSCGPVLEHFAPSLSCPVLEHFASSLSGSVLKHFVSSSGLNFEAFRLFNKRFSIEAFRSSIKWFIKRLEFGAFRFIKPFRDRSLIMPHKKNRRFEISLLQASHPSSLIDRFRSFS